MCGRGRYCLSSGKISKRCQASGNVSGSDDDLLERENFGPGMSAYIVIMDGDDRVLKKAQWGLIPAYRKEPIKSSSFFKKFNARSDNLEYVHSRLLARKHCIVCFNGFYEWRNEAKKLFKEKKQPYYVSDKQADILCIAGLYDECTVDEKVYTTFTIITVDASNEFKEIHNRMPALLETDEEIDAWLGTTTWSSDIIETFLRPKNCLKWHPVSQQMSKTEYQAKDCSQPAKLEVLRCINKMFPKASDAPKNQKSFEDVTDEIKKRPSTSASSPPSKKSNKLTCYFAKK